MGFFHNNHFGLPCLARSSVNLERKSSWWTKLLVKEDAKDCGD